MKTAFLVTTKDETSGRVTIEIVEHGSLAVLFRVDVAPSGLVGPGNRVDTRAVAKARGRVVHWCTKNAVMLTEYAAMTDGGAR